MEKKIKIGLLCLAIGIILIATWSYLGKSSVSEVVEKLPPDLPKEEIKLQPITSHNEAIKYANDYLNTTLGSDFVKEHFEVLGVDERPDISTIWFVLYKYRSNDHTIDLSLSVYISNHSSSPSRIEAEFSKMIKTPQEIKLSPNDAKTIATKNNLTPPYSTMLWITEVSPQYSKPKRLSWIVISTGIKEVCEHNGYVIDAENSEILGKLYNSCF